MVYRIGVVWFFRHYIVYRNGLARQGTVYGMVLWAWHGIWYGLAMFGMV